jgi:hypothetical protein
VGWVRLSLRFVDCCPRRSPVGTPPRQYLCAAYLVLICAMLVSCGGELRLVPPTSPSPQVISKPPAVAGATPVGTAVATQLGQIIWATAIDPATSAPIEPVSSYRPDAPSIIAVMQTFAVSAGSTFEATWEYNDTSLDAFSTRLAPTESSAESWISFYIERDPDVPWPVGTYEVTVSLNGTIMQQATVEVAEQP